MNLYDRMQAAAPQANEQLHPQASKQGQYMPDTNINFNVLLSIQPRTGKPKDLVATRGHSGLMGAVSVFPLVTCMIAWCHDCSVCP